MMSLTAKPKKAKRKKVQTRARRIGRIQASVEDEILLLADREGQEPRVGPSTQADGFVAHGLRGGGLVQVQRPRLPDANQSHIEKSDDGEQETGTIRDVPLSPWMERPGADGEEFRLDVFTPPIPVSVETVDDFPELRKAEDRVPTMKTGRGFKRRFEKLKALRTSRFPASVRIVRGISTSAS